MSIEMLGEVIHVTGNLRVEDAEILTGMLQASVPSVVDLTGSGTLHTAAVQVLLAFRPRVVGPSGDIFVNTWLLPKLAASLQSDTQSGLEASSETE